MSASVTGVPVVQQKNGGPKITIVKGGGRDIIPARKEALLKNIDYAETQVGRLAKMLRDMRAEVLALTTE